MVRLRTISSPVPGTFTLKFGKHPYVHKWNLVHYLAFCTCLILSYFIELTINKSGVFRKGARPASFESFLKNLS